MANVPILASEDKASVARLGFEHGADLVNSYYTEDVRRVTDNFPVPVLVAGGPRMETVEETLHDVNERAEG